MRLVDKLKQYERTLVFMSWGNSGEYGKINYVGSDFVEFEVLDTDKYEYVEKVIINPQLILSVVVLSSDLDRISIEYASNLPSAEANDPNLN